MRRAAVFYKGDQAGVLTEFDDGGTMFRYSEEWLSNGSRPSISLTLPKSVQEHRSSKLLPFFFNMLPEGTNKERVCKSLRIDTDDYFGILINTAHIDTIGAVTVKKFESS